MDLKAILLLKLAQAHAASVAWQVFYRKNGYEMSYEDTLAAERVHGQYRLLMALDSLIAYGEPIGHDFFKFPPEPDDADQEPYCAMDSFQRMQAAAYDGGPRERQ